MKRAEQVSAFICGSSAVATVWMVDCPLAHRSMTGDTARRNNRKEHTKMNKYMSGPALNFHENKYDAYRL